MFIAQKLAAGLLLTGAVFVSTRPGLAQRPGQWRLPLAGGPLELLARQDVQDELELVADQIRELRELRTKSRNRMRDRFAELRDGGIQNARQRIREIVLELRAELNDDLDQILLPHQTRRLRQLQLQRRLRTGNAIAFLTDEVVNQLAITEDQERQLRETGRDVERDLQRKLAAIREEARLRMMALLTPHQRRKLSELVGEPFRFNNESATGGEAPARGPERVGIDN